MLDATLSPYDAIVDPFVGDAFGVVDDPLPQSACSAGTPGIADSREAFLCTSAVSGGGGTGSTYYVGDSSYRCERLAEPYNESGNRPLPAGVLQQLSGTARRNTHGVGRSQGHHMVDAPGESIGPVESLPSRPRIVVAQERRRAGAPPPSDLDPYPRLGDEVLT